MEFSERERQIILLVHWDLTDTRANFTFDDGTSVIPLLRAAPAEVADLVLRFGGDPTALWFGATLPDDS
jgi:hypothetical protein